MLSDFWFHTSMQSSKNRYIPYNLGLKIVNNKTIWYVTSYFQFQVTCLPANRRWRHLVYQQNDVDVIALAFFHVIIIEIKNIDQHWPITEKQWRWKQTKLNYYLMASSLFHKATLVQIMLKHKISISDIDLNLMSTAL